MADSDWRRFENAIAACIESGGRELDLGLECDYRELLLDEQLNLIAQRLPEIEHLHLWFEDESTAALFCRRVAEFPNLQRLDLCLEYTDRDAALRTLIDQTTILPLIRYIHLNCDDDGLKAIASQAKHFTGLEEIFIGVCEFGDDGITALADQARHFVNLQVFRDEDEDLDPVVGPDGCKSLLNFTQLERLEVGSGRWCIDDEWLLALAKRGKEFTRLTTLEVPCTEVGDKGVKALAKHGKHFTLLKNLDLQVTTIGDEGVQALAEYAHHFETLESLMLFDTNVSDVGLKALALAWYRGEFGRIQYLGINGRSFAALQWIRTGEWAPSESRDQRLTVSSVAPEVLRTGDAAQIFEAVLNGLALPEAKLVVLGEPGVGKTSLCRRLFQGEPVDSSQRKVTHDFELIVPKWRPEVKGRDVQLRVWDFGGQHVLHGTHEMFLTSRSVCLLVLDATQVAEHDPDEEDPERDGNRLTYWLKMIRHFVGVNANVILVVTKHDEPTIRLRPINANELSKKVFFENVLIRLVPEFSATKTSYESRVDELRQEIHDALELLELPRVPREFVALKDFMENKMESRSFFGLGEYRQWCRDYGIKKQSDQDAYLRTLHRFGSVFYFGLLDCDRKQLEERRSRKRSRPSDDLPLGQRRLLEAERDPALLRWLINPRWLKWPLYRLIRESERQQWLSVDEIRSEAQQETPQILLDDLNAAEDIVHGVLELTELCFYDQARGKYFFPRGLSRESRAYLTGWDESNRHEAVWQWEFFPETVIHRFIVRAHQHGEVLNRAHWRTGVVLRRSETTVAIQCEPEQGRVTVWLKMREDNVQRPTRGDEDFLRRIHDRFHDLVSREPEEKHCSWEDGESIAADGDGLNDISSHSDLPSTESRSSESPRAQLPSYAEKAYWSYQTAAEAMPEKPTDKGAYAWVKKNGPAEYELPSFETWCKYVRQARKHYGTSKNTPRQGRSGRSIVDLSGRRTDEQEEH